MKNPIIRKLYTPEEIQRKVIEHTEKYKRYKTKNDYSSILSEYLSLATIMEIKEEKEMSEYYCQRIVDEWHAHLRGVPHYSYISALEMLCRPEEALTTVLSNPRMWDIMTLARLYEEVGRNEEAIIIYSGLAQCSLELSEAYHPFWRPHYLQKASDLHEKAQDGEIVHRYNERAVEAWEEVRDNIQMPLYLIEEAWLYEEVSYIYEKAGKLKTAQKYYQKAKSRYEKAHTEEPHSVAAHHIDGNWKDYFELFAYQIPDFRLIHFHSDCPEENDYRRIKYRILNLENQVRSSQI